MGGGGGKESLKERGGDALVIERPLISHADGWANGLGHYLKDHPGP